MDFPFRHKQPAEIGPPRSSLPASVDPDDADDDGAGKMSFLEHLDELRKRLTVSAIALAVGVLIAFLFIDRIFDFIMLPLASAMPKGSSLVATEPTEFFMLYMKIALLAGVVIAAPAITWQLWLFVAPGLYAKEKRFAVPFIVLASVCFVLGAAFSHYYIFPVAWKFLANFKPEYTLFMPKVEAVFSLYSMLLLATGIVFEMPAVILVLARMGLVTPGFLWRKLKYSILIIFIVAAVITPTGDMVTQSLVAAPMIGLYFISIIIAWVFGKKREQEPADTD
ncbi:MAG: twin-arginine translocase subunit TatC [Acidobacteria bacterium]|nr:twin-arginine translocase subunit TatC [Acidobacteriota bacterium]